MGTSKSGAYARFLKGEGGPILKMLVSLVYMPRSSPVAPCDRASMTYSPPPPTKYYYYGEISCVLENVLTKFCLNKLKKTFISYIKIMIL